MPAPSPSSEHIAESLVFRAALRREKLAARMALDEKAHATLSARIEIHLAALLTPLPPQTLSFCAPVRGEFDARPLASLLIERGWQVAMPIAETTNAPMSFRAWSPSSAMDSDRYGMPIPASGLAAVPDIVLLPLVAFDPQGFRLGYGGGYFDRTLAVLFRARWRLASVSNWRAWRTFDRRHMTSRLMRWSPKPASCASRRQHVGASLLAKSPGH